MDFIHTYWVWLAGLSVVFVALERLAPRHRAQGILREGFWTDIVYVVFNGHWLGVIIYALTAPLSDTFDALLGTHVNVASNWPWAVQFAVAFIGLDLIQYAIHNLLHRVPALWELHKVHHSIHALDFLGSMRFHAGEILVYKSLQYVPLALAGFAPSVMFAIAVIGTAIGHFNHANLGVRIGWLKYLVNNPEMHVWHHVHGSIGPTNVNFAINLALWDWLFGTAHAPPAPPERLGFTGDADFPRDPVRQMVWPLPRLFERQRR